jgi:hypothetical protein
MGSTYWQQWQQQQQQNQLNALAAQNSAGAGADPYMVQLAQQGQNGQFPPPTNSNGPYIPQQQQPSAMGGAGQLGGQMAGTYAAQQGVSALTGSAPAMVPASGGMTGITGTSAMGSIGGGSALPVGASATESALGIGAGAPTAAGVGGATTFASAEAAQAAGYTAVGSAADGGVLAIPATGGWGAAAAAALPWLGVAGLAVGTGMAGLDAFKNGEHKGWLGGTKEGIKSAGALNAVPLLGQVPWVAGALSGGFGGKKHKDQYAREAIEGTMKQGGFLDDQNEYTLADGNKFSFGIDGTHTLQNQGQNIDNKSDRHYYDVDFSDPRAGTAVAALQGLGAIFAGDDKKHQRDITGKLVNAALSSGDPGENIMKMIEDAGFKGHDQIYGAIHLMAEDKRISKEFADSVKNGLDEFYGVGHYANGAAPSKVPDAYAPKDNNGVKPIASIPTTPKDNNAQPEGTSPRDPRVAMRGPNASQVQKPVPTAPGVKPRVSPWISSALNVRGPGLMPRDNNVKPPVRNTAQVIRGR